MSVILSVSEHGAERLSAKGGSDEREAMRFAARVGRRGGPEAGCGVLVPLGGARGRGLTDDLIFLCMFESSQRVCSARARPGLGEEERLTPMMVGGLDDCCLPGVGSGARWLPCALPVDGAIVSARPVECAPARGSGGRMPATFVRGDARGRRTRSAARPSEPSAVLRGTCLL